MSTILPNRPKLNVGDDDRPRNRPRGGAVCVGGYYVDAAHVPPSASDKPYLGDRATTHVNPFRARARERQRRWGGQYAAPPTDTLSGEQEALLAFEAERMRLAGQRARLHDRSPKIA